MTDSTAGGSGLLASHHSAAPDCLLLSRPDSEIMQRLVLSCFRLWWSTGCPRAYPAAQSHLELTILSQLSKRWGHKHVPPHPASIDFSHSSSGFRVLDYNLLINHIPAFSCSFVGFCVAWISGRAATGLNEKKIRHEILAVFQLKDKTKQNKQKTIYNLPPTPLVI